MYKPKPSMRVSDGSNNKLESGLITALSTFATTPFDNEPKGVFGSEAKLVCGDVTISSATLDMEFEIPFDDDMEPNEAEIIIYNLSDNTIKQFENGKQLTLTAGYKGDTGVVFTGYISKVKTEIDGADKITTIYALDDIKDHTMENLSFKKKTKASAILKKLIDKTGLPVGEFKVRRDHTYKDAQTVKGNLMENIKKYAEVCGISVYVSKGKIYARHIKEGDNIEFSVGSGTGMIGSPIAFTEELTAEDFKETINGYEVEMLLQHRMCPGAIVHLNSRASKGKFRVCSGHHSFSPDEAITKIKMY